MTGHLIRSNIPKIQPSSKRYWMANLKNHEFGLTKLNYPKVVKFPNECRLDYGKMA